MEAAAAAAASKRTRTARSSAADRLSALSDELLCHILSFLPSRQAVQTTVLSKRWMDLWRSVATVSINQRDFEGGHWWRRLQDFTNNFLMLNTARCIDAFRLDFNDLFWASEFPDLCRDTERWVRRGIKCQPLVFQIRLYRNFRYHFQIPCLGSGFHRLKRLELEGVLLNPCFSDRLSSGCPVLEDLLLHECVNNFAVIQSDTLRNLVVRYCTSRAAGTLVVRAPCLASMSLDSIFYSNGLSLLAGNSLVKASISAMVHRWSPRTEAILLRSLFSVTSLELKCFQAMALLDNELDKFPVFVNLRTLSLSYCFFNERDADKFKALGRFLHKSPNLEELTLLGFCVQVKPVVGPIKFPMLENLRTLVLDECDSRDNFQILRHLLRSSPNLEKLTLYVGDCCELPEVSMGRKGKAKWRRTCPRFGSLVRFQCPKLKSSEIIYQNGVKIQELVSFLLDISGSAAEKTVTLTKI